jgi:Cys-tRNA(Pro)/Cys-tRNA(Cys) deacylase
MAGTPATVALTRAGVPFQVHEYDHAVSRGWGAEAAEALGLDPARVFKTLMAEADGPVVAIVPVVARLDLKALAAACGAKRAALMDPAVAQRRTGYMLGGISPFGQKQRAVTVVDDTALGFPTMFVSGGRRGLEIEVAPADLVRVLDARPAAVATGLPG